MLSAFIKAFTGRAGALGSVLALLIIALIAYTVVDRLPKVEQNVLVLSQGYLEANMAPADTLMSLQVIGREVHLGGDFQNPATLKSGLTSIEGVRRVFLVGSSNSTATTTSSGSALESRQVSASTEVGSVEKSTNVDETVSQQVSKIVTELLVDDASEPGSLQIGEQDDPATSVATEPVRSEQTLDVDAAVAVSSEGGKREEGKQERADLDKAVNEQVVAIEESSLSLRYDGTELTLTGHVADEQMASLLVKAVARAIPPYSVLNADVDGNGKASPLNWMRRFLKIASRLPEDAQGLITGSDSNGVQILPDEEQTLSFEVGESQTGVNEARQMTPERVESAAQASEADTTVAESTQERLTAEEVSNAAQEEVAMAVEVTTESTATVPPSDETQVAVAANPVRDPAEFIMALNSRLADAIFFQPGVVNISDALALELDGLVNMLQQHPSLYLRIVGNIDSSVDKAFEEFVGMDRALEVQNYLRTQKLEAVRVFTAPLPRGYAFDERVQLVFYISE